MKLLPEIFFILAHHTTMAMRLSIIKPLMLTTIAITLQLVALIGGIED